MRKYYILFLFFSFILNAQIIQNKKPKLVVLNEYVGHQDEIILFYHITNYIDFRMTLTDNKGSTVTLDRSIVSLFPNSMKIGDRLGENRGGFFLGSIDSLIFNNTGEYKIEFTGAYNYYNDGYQRRAIRDSLKFIVYNPEMITPLPVRDSILLGENFQLDFATFEYDDKDRYTYSIKLENNEISSGRGPIVDLTDILSKNTHESLPAGSVLAGKMLTVEMKYNNASFEWIDSSGVPKPSTWSARIVRPQFVFDHYWAVPNSDNSNKMLFDCNNPDLSVIRVWYNYPNVDSSMNRYSIKGSDWNVILDESCRNANFIRPGELTEEGTQFVSVFNLNLLRNSVTSSEELLFRLSGTGRFGENIEIMCKGTVYKVNW